MLVVIGFAGGGIPTVAANLLLLKNIAVAGRELGHLCRLVAGRQPPATMRRARAPCGRS